MKSMIAALVLASTAWAQNIGNVWLNQPTRPSLTISVGKTYVTIKPDGTIEYGEGYTPDAAAKAFWEAIGRSMPMCKEASK